MRTTLQVLSRSRGERALVSSRFRQYPFLSSSSISCLCFINALFCRFVSVPLQHALFRLSSFIRFTRVSSRPLSRPFVISLQPSCVRFCFTDPLCYCLSFSVSNLPECLSSTSLCAVSSFSNYPWFSPFIHYSFHASFSLSPSSCLPPTHAHPPPSSSAGSVRIGPAR